MCTISSMLSKIAGTYSSMVKAFRRVYDTSKIDVYNELLNIRMREGEAVAAFANRFKGLIPASIDPDNELIKYHFIHKPSLTLSHFNILPKPQKSNSTPMPAPHTSVQPFCNGKTSSSRGRQWCSTASRSMQRSESTPPLTASCWLHF